MVCGLMVVGENREAPTVIAIENVELVTDESGNQEALNDLVNDQANTEKVDEAEKVPEADVVMTDTKQVNEANVAPGREELTEEMENTFALIVPYDMGFLQYVAVPTIC